MSGSRPLRGSCHCGRNRYIVTVPQDGLQGPGAQVLFNTEPHHQIPLATPLAAYIRVPLAWYHSTTYAFFPDETHNMIRRVYTHPSQDHSKRHFCGFCGTPLSYWSEEPRSEADFINLTIGSLLREDLQDLDDMGLLPDEREEEEEEEDSPDDDKAEKGADAGGDDTSGTPALRQSSGVTWLDGLVEGTRLGKMRRSQGVKRSQDGRVKIEWDIVEFSEPGDGSSDAGNDRMEAEMPYSGKRKFKDRED